MKQNFQQSVRIFLRIARIFGLFPYGRNNNNSSNGKWISRLLTLSVLYSVVVTTVVVVFDVDCGLILLQKIEGLRTKISETAYFTFSFSIFIEIFIKCLICILGAVNGPALSKVFHDISNYDNKCFFRCTVSILLEKQIAIMISFF